MKIEAIEIYGYGKWMDKTFQVDESLQVFYGGNEAGKTTLMSFIHSVLFGFPHRQSSELRYEPKTGSRYGGKLVVQDSRCGKVSIERVKGRASGEVNVSMENGRTGSDELLNELLYGMDKEWYQSIFSFNLEGIQYIDRMTKEKLNRYFLSAGTLGTEQFLKEADKLNTMASKLYKPTGRVPAINKKMKDVESKRKRVEAAKKKNSQYAELVNKKQEAEQTISSIREKMKETEEVISNLKRMEREWPRFEEMRSLQQELNRFPFESLPEDGLHQLNHFSNTLENLRNSEVQEQEKLHQYQETYRPSKLLDFYQQNEKQFEGMQEELEEVRIKIMNLQQLLQDEEEMKQRLLKEKLRLGLNPIETMPDVLSKEEKKNVLNMNIELKKIERNLEETQSRLSLLAYKRQSLSEEIDVLENKLWSNSEYDDIKTEMEQKLNAPKTSSVPKEKRKVTIMQWTADIIGLILVASSFFLAAPMRWMAVALGVVFLTTGILSWRKKGKEKQIDEEENRHSSSSYSYEEYIKQTEIRKSWRVKLAESDENEQNKRMAEKEKEDLLRDRQIILNKWGEMKEEKRLPEAWSMEQITIKEEEMQSIRTDEDNLEEKRKQINEVNAYLNKWKESLTVIQDELNFSSTYSDLFQQVKRLFQAVKEEEKRQQEYISRSKDAHRELERLVKEIRKTETKKRRLLKAVDVETEETFRNKYAIRDEMNQKKARWELLQSQLIDSLDLFEEFRNKEELIEALETAEGQIQQLKVEDEKQTNFKIQREVEIRKLEEGGDYAVLLQEYENSKSELQFLVDEWASLKIAADLIERTLNYAKKDRLPGTVSDAEDFFIELTEGNYTKIKLEDDSLKVLHKNGLLYDATELSRGTAEQLYVSLRLAFINNIKDAMELPLLVDDGFVNFDPLRKRRMWTLLEKTSKQTQVLYFTFDSETMEAFEQAATIVL